MPSTFAKASGTAGCMVVVIFLIGPISPFGAEPGMTYADALMDLGSGLQSSTVALDGVGQK
jgi:hypothetical protein